MGKARTWFPISSGLLTWKHYQRIAAAWMIFLWMIHEQRAPKDGEPNDGAVRNGEPISYECIGACLYGMPGRTVERHVRVLEAEGYIRSESGRGRAKRYWVTNPIRWAMVSPKGTAMVHAEVGAVGEVPAEVGRECPQKWGESAPNFGEANKEQEPKTKDIRAKRVSLPKDFGISDRVRAWAIENGFDRLEDHLEYFTGYAKARGAIYADWNQAFMNCIRGNWAKLNGNEAIGQPLKRKTVNPADIIRQQEAEGPPPRGSGGLRPKEIM